MPRSASPVVCVLVAASRPAQAAVASERPPTVRTVLVARASARLRALFRELCATALELVTLGEVRLVPAVRSVPAGGTARQAGRPCDAGAVRPGSPSGRSCGDPSLTRRASGHRRPGPERRIRLGESPAPRHGSKAAGRCRPLRGRRHGDRARSARRPVRSSPRRQPIRSSAQPSSPLRRTMRKSPSRDVATRCARSSWTPGRSSTRTRWSSS